MLNFHVVLLYHHYNEICKILLCCWHTNHFGMQNDGDDSVTQFFQASASMAGTHQNLAMLMGETIKHPKIYLSKIALWLLSTWIGTFILCGRQSLLPHFLYFQRFSLLPSENRQQILLSWSQSYFFLLRLLYNGAKTFTLLLFFSEEVARHTPCSHYLLVQQKTL